MSCSPFDLRDYFLKELADPQQRQVEDHVKDCPACREELERLRLTQAALYSLRDEEIPQRIAFVSDPVFEPSRWRRGWAAFWGSSARLGFAAAAMLSVAILVSALTRPLPAPAPAPAPAPSRTITAADYYTRGEVDQRIQTAVAASETKTLQQVKDLTHRVDAVNNLRLIAENQADYLQKQYYSLQRATGGYVLKASAAGESR